MIDEDKTNIPAGAIPLFALLQGDLTRMCARWKIFKGLYGSGPRRAALLTHTASWFFSNLRVLLIDDVVLGVARLLDPPAFGKHQNQSIERLSDELSLEPTSDLSIALTTRLQAARTNCDAFIVHRNKRVAHRDLATAQSAAALLPGLTIAGVDEALQHLEGFLNEIEHHYDNNATLYTEVVPPYHEDAEGLIWALQKANVLDSLIDDQKHWDLIQLAEFKDA